METLDEIQSRVNEAKAKMLAKKKEAEREYIASIRSNADSMAEIKGYKVGDIVTVRDKTILIEGVHIGISLGYASLIISGPIYTKKNVPAKSGKHESIYIDTGLSI